MVHYKLTYFPARGRLEFVRMLFEAANVPYEEVTVSFEDWPKVKPTIPLGQLPTLEVDGKLLLQSETIGRYLAREFGFAGKDNWEMAQIEMIIDGCTDMQNAYQSTVIPQVLSGNTEQVKIEWAKFRDEKLKPFMTEYTKLLADNKTGWFVGDKMTVADIRVSEMFERFDVCFQPGFLNEFPKLLSHAKKTFAQPGVSHRVANRPDYKL